MPMSIRRLKSNLMFPGTQDFHDGKTVCPICLKQFSRKYTRNQHVAKAHPEANPEANLESNLGELVDQ